MSEIRENTKRNIAYYLSIRGVKQAELARYLGVSQSSVAHWATGANMPDIEMISKICNFFEIPLTEILGNNGGEPFTEKERLIIYRYRERKDMQRSVDVLLGLQKFIICDAPDGNGGEENRVRRKRKKSKAQEEKE